MSWWRKRRKAYCVTRQLYRKPTHADRYLQSGHHPTQKRAGVLPLSIVQDHLWRWQLWKWNGTPKTHLQKKNGYSSHQRGHACQNKPRKQKVSPTRTLLLPYMHSISNNISRLLVKNKIKIIPMPVRQTINTLRSVKDNLGSRCPVCPASHMSEEGCTWDRPEEL